MILTCSECATRFNAKDEAFLPAGRKVRCAKCGHVWHQPPPGQDEEAFAAAPAPAMAPAEPAPPPAVEPPSRPAARQPEPEPEPETPAAASSASIAEPAERPSARRGGGAVLVAGWVMLVLAVLAIAWGAIAFRQNVVRTWPQSASLYSALGMPVNTTGIAFTDVNYSRQVEDSETVLAVTGTLVNVTARPVAVPLVRVVLSGPDGKELYRWQFKPPTSRLAPGQKVPFKTRLSSPPDGARRLTLEFATAK